MLADGAFGNIAHRGIHGARVVGEPGKVFVRHHGQVHMQDCEVRRHAPVGTVHDADLVGLRAPRGGDIAQVIADPLEVLVAVHQDIDARHGVRRVCETWFNAAGAFIIPPNPRATARGAGRQPLACETALRAAVWNLPSRVAV